MANDPRIEQLKADIADAEPQILEAERVISIIRDAKEPVADLQAQLNDLKIKVNNWRNALNRAQV